MLAFTLLAVTTVKQRGPCGPNYGVLCTLIAAVPCNLMRMQWRRG
ncbi:MAG: hypothetical protein JWN34_5445 [Bryobacterales bacterium]|nr:hypothetical protein [Bryobacterales bacterium]